MTRSAHDPQRWSGRGFILAGAASFAAVFGGVGYWAMATELSSAVVAAGELRVESKVKPISHPQGGRVGELLVREGDLVAARQVLLRLDATTATASLAIVQGELEELEARRARLEAERDGVERVVFPEALRAKAAKAVSDQGRLFEARLTGHRQRRDQYGQRVGQIEREIESVGSRIQAYRVQQGSISAERGRLEHLLSRGFAPLTRVEELRREEAQLLGEIGALEQDVSRLRRQIQETTLQIGELDERRREEALSELREVETRVSELRARHVVASDELKRVDVVAPEAGVAQGLTVFGPEQIVGPGQVLMQIVPVADRLVLEARVNTPDRDRISLGQRARARFTAFNQRRTPELEGSVAKISADRFLDEATRMPYYLVEIEVSDAERARLGAENELTPGMPAEIYLQTEARTPMDYLLKPLVDNFERAFKEE